VGRRRISPALLAAASSVVAVSLSGCPRWAEGGASAAAPAGPGVAVVELFTSQGCSSCPPADRLLTRLAEEPQYRGRLVALSFHVDYWNHIGWTDPFSSPRWSERQRRYARAVPPGRVYTPQVRVQGGAAMVGSDERAVRHAIAAALSRAPAARVRLQVGEPAGAAQGQDRGAVLLRAAVEVVGDAGTGELDLWLAVLERALVTPVTAGENRSATLRNDHVVRHFERLATLPARAGTTRDVAVTVPLDAAWDRSQLAAAAFAQDPRTLAIHGADALDLPPSP
jgi:hypothetical protein